MNDRLARLPTARNRSRLLRNDRVWLRDVLPQHYSDLYKIARSDAVADGWQSDLQSISYEHFCSTLWQSVLVQFGFSKPGVAAELDGLVRCSQANFRDQTAQLSMFASGRSQGTGLPIQAIGTFANFVMQTYPIRKLYAEVPEYNFVQLEDGAGIYFEVEGRLCAHELMFGEEWDTLILAISRRLWDEEIRPEVESWGPDEQL